MKLQNCSRPGDLERCSCQNLQQALPWLCVKCLKNLIPQISNGRSRWLCGSWRENEGYLGLGREVEGGDRLCHWCLGLIDPNNRMELEGAPKMV